MSTTTWIILGCIAVLLAGIKRVTQAGDKSDSPHIALNALTLSFVAAVGIAILIGMAALSIK